MGAPGAEGERAVSARNISESVSAVKSCRCTRFTPTLACIDMPFPFPLPHRVPLYLAPMAGVSESPFRRLCRRFGADVVVTEFLSAEGIRRENEATIAKLRFGSDERPIGVQIFGSDPAAMGDAAALVRSEERRVGKECRAARS